MPDTPDDERQSFAVFLTQHNKGRSEHDLSEALREVVEAVTNTGKTGQVTYVLTIKPQENTDNAMVVSDEIKKKVPELDRPASIFFADDQHRLTRSDPRQHVLPFTPQER